MPQVSHPRLSLFSFVHPCQHGRNDNAGNGTCKRCCYRRHYQPSGGCCCPGTGLPVGQYDLAVAREQPQVDVNTVGGVVDGGTVMAEMVPIEGEVTVRARVKTDDVSKINVGQDVRISLTAYDVLRYGTLTGKVQKIANNSTQEENLPPYFVTLIKIPDPQFEQSGFAPEVVPGMTVIVDVLGGKRTVINYILSPIERAQSIAFREK